MKPSLIYPDWPLRNKVQAFATTRVGGVSQPPFDDFNLAVHVTDNQKHVLTNRNRLKKYLPEDVEIKWLKQIHGNCVVNATKITSDQVQADAAFSTDEKSACAILTADCLPILLADARGQCVGAVHAGWRGIINGVIENTIVTMSEFAMPEYVWLGPAISQKYFEVGDDVYNLYLQKNPALACCFMPRESPQQKPAKWFLDLYHAAKIIINDAGIGQVYGGGLCTYHDMDQFFSYRRERITGRIATIIARCPSGT